MSRKTQCGTHNHSYKTMSWWTSCYGNYVPMSKWLPSWRVHYGRSLSKQPRFTSWSCGQVCVFFTLTIFNTFYINLGLSTSHCQCCPVGGMWFQIGHQMACEWLSSKIIISLRTCLSRFIFFDSRMNWPIHIY